MALVLKDRVKETTTTTGTGTVTLAGASTGYQAFSAIGNGNTTYYVITDPATGAWEVGLGTYTASGTTLSRTTVLSSSNAGSLVNFGSGTKEVFCAYPAEKAIYEEASGETLIDGGPITVVGSGVTVVPSLPAELGKFVGNVDLFAQIYNLNQNPGTSASADFVAYNDLTTDGYTNFIDMGINSSTYSSVDYPLFTPGSGYLFHDGDHLYIGTATTNKDVVIFTGGVDTPNEAMRILGTDQSVELVGNLSVGGTLTVTGAAEFDSTVLLSADPTLALQAATKQYVDNATSNGFHVHTPVLVATTGNLTATYNNGTSGVGATLTNSGTQVALSIDGVSLSVADRVLVWQQTTGTQNGVYVVTTVGSGSTNWVLTRSSDADTSSEGDPNSLGGGDYFFVDSGTTLGYHSFICTNTDVITFGTTAITFSEFSSVPAYTGGTNISVSGSTISLTGTVDATNGGTGVNTVTTGDLLYGSASNTWSKLAKGSSYASLVMNAGGTNVEWNAVNLSSSNAVTGVLPATYGGTGLSTYTTGDTVYSSAANTLSKLSGNTTTTPKYMRQVGTGSASQAPTWDTLAASDITSGTLAVARGGTNLGSYTTGDLLYASGTTTLAALADVATGNVLLSGGAGVAPSYGKVVFGTHTSGTLAVDQGGTGANTLTGYVYGNGTGAMTASTTIPNSATTATSANTASAIVARDASGNFTAGTITAALSGNATTATTLQTARTINGTSFNGSADITVTANTTNTLSIGSYLTGSNFNGSAATTWAVDATSANTASKVVARDGSGNFSAGTITATLSGNASTATSATNASNITGGNQTGDYQVTQGKFTRFGASSETDGNDGKIGAGLFASGLNIVGTQTTGGTGRQVRIWGSVITDSGTAYVYNSGTWNISVTGSAGSASTATLATKASTLAQGGGSGTGMTFNWSGQSGQPTWLWGSNDGTNIYVWNPSNFSVNYAATAGNTSSISSAVGGTYTWTGLNYFRSNQNTSGSNPPLQAYSDNASGAIMSFHRGGYYAVNMGLDSDNVFRIGGWSASANRLQMDMSGNLTMAGSITAGAPFFLNPNTVSANFTVPASYNAHSAGPITVNSGVTVTVSTGASWSIV